MAPFPAGTWYLILGLPICLLGIVGLIVNPFPQDFWFWSWQRLFVKTPLFGAAYTPIALPAYVYGSTHLLALAFGVGLEHEFRIAAAALGVLQFISCGFVLLSCRDMGRPRLGLAVSIGCLLFAQSTYMTQAFWSEGVTNPVVAATMYAVVRLYVNPPQTVRSALISSTYAGLGVGVLTISRVMPGLLLCAFLFIAWQRLERSRAIVYGASTLGIAAAICLGQMAANQYRFGQFVLSDSGGLHLWNVVTPIAEEILTDSEDYQSMKRLVPDVGGKMWWEVCSALRAKTSQFQPCPVDRIKGAAFHGAMSHPGRFLAHGLGNFKTLLVDAPNTFGLWMEPGLGFHRDPLSRTTYLPALVPVPAFSDALDAIHSTVEKHYRTIVLGSILLSVSGVLLGIARRLRGSHVVGQGHGDVGGRGAADAWPLAVALLWTFLVCTFATAATEEPQPRFNAVYLPLLGVLLCYSIGLVGDLLAASGSALRSRLTRPQGT